MDAEIVRYKLYQLSIHTSMGPDGIHPTVLDGCYGRTPLNHVSKVWGVWGGLHQLEANELYSHLQEKREGRARKLQTYESDLSTQKSCGDHTDCY